MNESLKKLISDIVVPVLKPSGFKKTKLNFHKKHNGVMKLVNIQVSQTGFDFYINVGLSFDEIRIHNKQPSDYSPKYSECFFVSRLESLIPAPEKWPILHTLAHPSELEQCVANLDSELRKIISLDTFYHSDWFNRIPMDRQAIVAYIFGDLSLAKDIINKLSEEYQKAGYNYLPQHWIERHNLVELK